MAGHPVKVTCVHPGYIKTDIVRHMDSAEGVDTDALVGMFDKIARTSPERVAKIVLRAVEKNKARVLPGADAKAYDLLVQTDRGRLHAAVASAASETVAADTLSTFERPRTCANCHQIAACRGADTHARGGRR